MGQDPRGEERSSCPNPITVDVPSPQSRSQGPSCTPVLVWEGGRFVQGFRLSVPLLRLVGSPPSTSGTGGVEGRGGVGVGGAEGRGRTQTYVQATETPTRHQINHTTGKETTELLRNAGDARSEEKETEEDQNKERVSLETKGGTKPRVVTCRPTTVHPKCLPGTPGVEYRGYPRLDPAHSSHPPYPPGVSSTGDPLEF